MKILVLSNLYPPHSVGGYEVACEEFVSSFSRDDVTVLTTSYGLPAPSADNGVLRVLPNVFGDWPHGDMRLPRGFRRFFMHDMFRTTSSWIKAIRPDVCYIWNLGQLSLGPLFAARIARLPVVFHLEDRWLPDTLYHPGRTIEATKQHLGTPVIFGKRVGAIFVSEFLRRSYASSGYTFPKSRVIPNGIVPGAYPPRNYEARPAGALRLLYAGRIVPEKGVRVLIEAIGLAEARAPGALQLSIAGPGEKAYLAELAEAAARQRVAAEWLGPMARSDLSKLYATHDLLVVPSVWDEPFGLVAIEAMAAGTAVVAAASGGLPEIVSHGSSGMLVPPSDPIALADALTTFVERPILVEEMGRCAHSQVCIRFDLATSAAAAREFIADLVAA